MFVATVGKFPFVYPSTLGFLLTKAGNSSLCWHITFISISVCFLTYLILNICWHCDFQYIFCQKIISEQNLDCPVSSWGHPCQQDRCQPVGEMSSSHREKKVQPLSKLRNFWNTQQVGPPCKLLPFQRNYNVGMREKALVFTRTSACHAVCAPNLGVSHSVGRTRGTKASKFDGFWHKDFNHNLQPGALLCTVKIHTTIPIVLWSSNAALDPKQHSSNGTWSWRGHLRGHSIQCPPLAPSWAACAAPLAQQTSTSTVCELQHWQMTFQQLTLLSEGVSSPPWLTTFLPATYKIMKSTFPSWQRWGLYTFHIFTLFWFGDNLYNKTD